MIGMYIQKWAKAMNRQSIEKVNKISSNVTHSSRCWGFSAEDERVFLLSWSLNVSK